MNATQAPKLNEREFKLLSSFIEKEVGIKMPPEKKILMESRLQKRLKKHGIGDFKEYCQFVFDDENAQGELIELIDAITTNKTDFMREPVHFDFLVQQALPDVTRNKSRINLWSAACSTGQEPYNLAMFMEEFKSQTNSSLEYAVTATDISNSCLEKARKAIYTMEDIEDIPLSFRKNYLLKSRDPKNRQIRIKQNLRDRITFKSINLMKDNYGINDKYDIVFCRNVLIYFDRDNQIKVINRILRHMNPGGYLFLGHSESMAGVNSNLKSVASSIYKKNIAD
jgi:chemotaxis protein methyltransferase CheR